MTAISISNKTNPIFKVAGDHLFNFISSLTEPAHIKTIKDGKYIFSNESNLEIYGLSNVNDITENYPKLLSPYLN